MKDYIFPLLTALLLATIAPASAETISFQPGDLSATVKGELVADKTKEYIFRGKAGQSFELQATAHRGQHLIIHVRDQNKNDVFQNFQSGRLEAKGVLPSSGDYSIYLALRRSEMQLEGRVKYALTLTLHEQPQAVAIEKGVGEYFVSDGQGSRTVNGVTVALGTDGKFKAEVQLGGDAFQVSGTWRLQGDEALLLEPTEAFGQAVKGRGIVLLDDEFVDNGKPTHIMLTFNATEQGSQHSLTFGE